MDISVTLGAVRSLFLSLLVLTLAACHGTTVRGVVLGDLGEPVAGAEVRIEGTAMRTATDGSFEFTPASDRYDVNLAVGNNCTTYRGLSRKNPVLFARGAAVGTRHVAQIAGTLTGGSGFPVDASSANVLVAVDLPLGFGGADGASGTFSMNAGWLGGPVPVQGTLRVLERAPASAITLDRPSNYLAYGERTISIAPGDSLADLQIAVKTVGTAHASGHLSVPADSTVSGLRFAVVFDAVALDEWFDDTPSSTSAFTVPMPDLPGAAVRVEADAFGAVGFTRAWRFLRPGMTDVAVEVPHAPVLLSPMVEAKDLARSSALSWNDSPGGVYLLDVDGPDASTPHFRVVTTATSVLLSELDALARVPPSTTMTWRVTAIRPFADVDAAATSAGYPAVANLALRGLAQPDQDLVVAPSSGQAFTVAP